MRTMLEGLGVRVIEVEGLGRPAVYVRTVGVLLIRPGADEGVLSRAADLVLLPDRPPLPRPRR